MLKMRYKCIKELYIDEYDEDGFSTGGWFSIPVGSIWEIDDSGYKIVGGNDTVHLNLVTEQPKYQWLEILDSTLKEHFELIN